MLWLSLGPLLSLLAVGAGWDIARRRVPNPVSAAAVAVGLAYQGQWAGTRGVGAGLAAAVVVLVILWIPWDKGRLGGGDVKLGMAAAIPVGLSALPVFLLSSAVAGGVVAIICYLGSKPWARQEIRDNLRLAVLQQPLTVPAQAPSGSGRLSVPYGVAFVVGCYFSLALRFGTFG